MHVHIPSVSDAKDAKGNTFKVFNLYFNGIYHSSLRYSQFLELHNEVKKNFKMDDMVEFPPKILRITEWELDWRRRMLERYIHCLCQDRNIGNSKLLINFLLTAQKVSSAPIASPSVQLEVYLCNGKSKQVTCSPYTTTPTLLLAACEAIGIESEYACYFGLFFEYTKKDDDNWTVLCLCSDVHLPYLSFQSSLKNDTFTFRLSIRKWYFNPLYTATLVNSKTCLNMLYIEGLDILEGERQTELPEEVIRTLLSIKKSRKEFVEKLNENSVANEKYCTNITVGEQREESILRISGRFLLLSQKGKGRSGKIYPISKLRCWKVGVTRNGKEHFFAFEFEYETQKFKWYTLRGHSTIFLTQCIGKAVEEYILLSQDRSYTPITATVVDDSIFKSVLTPPTLTSGPLCGVDILHVAVTSTTDDDIIDTQQDNGNEDDMEPSDPHTSVDTSTSSKTSTVPTSPVDTPTSLTSNSGGTFNKAPTTPATVTTPTTPVDTPTSLTSNSGGSTSIHKQKKTKKPSKQQVPVAIDIESDTVFNTTFVGDSDL